MTAIVSVIIPAFNAAPTIARTIASAQRQTVSDIEILVIDDGSTDATRSLAEQAAREDSRIKVLSQANAGVCAARNRALAEASSAFMAPLDADDIWHAEKLERQLSAIRAAPAGTGLVYNWYRRIDDNDRVVPVSPSPRISGQVLHRHLEWNFISNGSNILVPAELARSVGYAQPIPGAGQQGAEDYLFQLRLARTHRFACVPAWLTGYRLSRGGLSTGVERMLRAHLAMYAIMRDELATEYPSALPVIARRRAELLVELARNRLRRGKVPPAIGHLGAAFTSSPRAAIEAVLREFSALRSRMTEPHNEQARPFHDYAPDEPDGAWRTRRSDRLLSWLESLDRTGP